MKRLFVTGAGGFLGWHVCRLASAAWDVFGICRRDLWQSTAGETIAVDLTDFDRLDSVMCTLCPDAVIHTAAEADPNFCERHPERTRPINVEVPVHLARYCARRSIPLLFTSSDLVFDGTCAPYGETDPPAPVNIYGRQKAQAEKAVLDTWPGALVCRMPLMFGWSGSESRAFDQVLIRSIRKNRPVSLFVDEFRTPVDAQSAAAGLLHLLGRASGILHLGGRERISRHEMGVRIAAMMGASNALLVPVGQGDISMAAERPPDLSLVSSRAYRLGYDPAPLDRALAEAVRRAENPKAV